MITFPQQFYAEIARYRADTIRGFRPRFQQDAGKPDEIYALEARNVGAMSRLLRLTAEEREYFWYASMFYWPFDTIEPPGAWYDDTRAYLLCHAAICAHLAGRDDRALVLREWALQQYEATPASLYEPWKPGGPYESDRYGQFMLFWAYTAASLGRWDEVAPRCAEAVASYERAVQHRRIVSRELLALARALQAAVAQQANPGPEHRKAMEQALAKVVKAGRDSLANARACIYLWDLEDALPGLIGEIGPAPSQCIQLRHAERAE